MKLMPSSRVRASTRLHSSTSAGGPQIPGPVSRMAPKPSRLTDRSPPIANVPPRFSPVIHRATACPERWHRGIPPTASHASAAVDRRERACYSRGMRNLVLGAVLALASISGCAKDKTEPAAKAEENFPSMTVAEVDQAITAKQATAVDCN